MASFFGGRRGDRGAREAAVKKGLTDNLSECVKAIQFRQTERADRDRSAKIGSDDLTGALCVALEAIFLHGVKDTLLSRARSAFGGDVDRKPEPNFWPLLLVLSHGDSIRRIGALSCVTTEIGQCRAWIRVALNDCLLSSYFALVRDNMGAPRPYYERWAYVRDPELLDVAKRLVDGIETCAHFDLPVNSSLLNSWPEEALALAAIWTPTMRSCPIASGVDVASTIREPEPKRETFIPGRSPLGRTLAIDPDEALHFILSNTPENFMDEINDRGRLVREEPPPETAPEDGEEESADRDENAQDESEAEPIEPVAPQDAAAMGNSISGKTAWSPNSDAEPASASPSGSLPSDLSFPTDEEEPPKRSLDLRERLREHLKIALEEGDEIPKDPRVSVSPDDPALAGLGFEVVSKSLSSTFDHKELQKMTSLAGTLARELGLGSQEHACVGCGDALGPAAHKPVVCAFTGQYFCLSCMDPNPYVIPARAVHNWDFQRYPVSKRAALFLTEFQDQPLINMKKSNPLIYTGVAEMSQLQDLRIQLNFLKAYLFTCRENVIEELQKRVWPREYLYEHIHSYSISDLNQIYNGTLTSQLQKLVSHAQNHVKDCWLCSQKGFICEVCKNPKILYPFDIYNTYRCEICSSVFHANCLNAMNPCPKCKRIKKRLGKTLVDAVHNNF